MAIDPSPRVRAVIACVAKGMLGSAAVALFAGCTPTPSGPGGSCQVNTDCQSGLSCVGNVCMTVTADVVGDVTDATRPDTFDVSTDVIDVAPDAMDVPPPPPDDVVDVVDTGTEAMSCRTAPADAAVCATHAVRPLALPDTECGTLAGASAIDSTLCESNTGGPEDVFSLAVSAMTGVTLSVNASIDTVLSVRLNCTDATSEIACSESQGSRLLPFIRMPLVPGNYTVIVDEFGSMATGGAYTLAVNTYTPAANALCTGATSLTSTLSSEHIATGNSAVHSCRTTDTGPVLFYSVAIPAGQRAMVTATPGGGTWRAFLHAMSACSTNPDCLGDAEAIQPSSPVTLTVPNTGTTTLHAIVEVAASEEPTDSSDAFSLGVTVGP